MPPQYSPQPAPPPLVPQPGGQDQYHFIMNPEPPKRQIRLLPNNSSPKGRLAVVVGGVIILLIIVWVVGSLISSSGKSGTQELVDLTARQQELVRISVLGSKTARGEDVQDLAITAQLALASDQQQLLNTLQKSRVKVNKNQLNSRKNAQTDALLTQANQTNQFDAVFNKTMQEELTSYQKAIKAAYDANTGKKVRALLTTEFNDASTLLGPPQTQSK